MRNSETLYTCTCKIYICVHAYIYYRLESGKVETMYRKTINMILSDGKLAL